MSERLIALKNELEKGRQQMMLLDRRRHELRDTILRIAGAIQVLEEIEAESAAAQHKRPVLTTIA